MSTEPWARRPVLATTAALGEANKAARNDVPCLMPGSLNDRILQRVSAICIPSGAVPSACLRGSRRFEDGTCSPCVDSVHAKYA